MDYMIKDDMKLIREFYNFSQAELAKEIYVDKVTISRTENGETIPRNELLENLYSYCFSKGLRLNNQKEMFYKDDIDNNHILLTHGSKNGIDGELSVERSRQNNDFGKGFYCGDSYDKSISFVCRFKQSNIYFIDFDPNGLNKLQFDVDTNWMLTIAYFRGRLEPYKDNKLIRRLIEPFKNVDYVIAPIADNRMFQIIDTFIDGEISDEQCKHCLAATNLGMQYVFLTEKSLKHINILERCFISSKEKEYYQKQQIEFQKIGADKSRLARIQYRDKGKYIEEILIWEKLIEMV